MTYCCGVLVRDGLVLIADTRTNAGLDNISTFRKLHIFEEPGHHVLGLATAGNLSVSQSVVSLLREGVEDHEAGERHQLRDCRTMFQAAQLVGTAIRQVHKVNGELMEQSGISFEVSFLLGGQILGDCLRLYMVYSAGNFIECTPDTPFLQIGEHKYGKPVLDRAVTYEMEISDALKSSLISMDSTMRSNLGVGLPIDVMVVSPDTLRSELLYRVEPGEPYFHDLRERWSAALRSAHASIPRPPYLKDVRTRRLTEV
ncbi:MULTISPECIES: proteasome-type protease [Xanthobacter]|uniref:20S proteasome A and B subunits n=2 Tax=Xanthobacter TaxID=279 RepID=A7ILX2_XANP2|nr:proteasome-type protease [Xanthobacter oligotrophicus]ABS69015.1 20S proteasome A and B subunits [Xanthobacter autotrophicus Py2]MCG5237564.1 proteasome-type protease [Xanthobacter oligotrophicus]